MNRVFIHSCFLLQKLFYWKVKTKNNFILLLLLLYFLCCIFLFICIFYYETSSCKARHINKTNDYASNATCQEKNLRALNLSNILHYNENFHLVKIISQFMTLLQYLATQSPTNFTL